MTYFAAKNGSGYALKSSDEMESALDRGFSIFEDDGTKEKEIANPDEGWLVEPPIFGPSECRAVQTDVETLRALNILLYGKEEPDGNSE